MRRFSTIWDVTPETAHPRARQLIDQSTIWNFGDEDSPLGNDTGADTFAEYLDYRAAHPDEGIHNFLYQRLADLGISDADWDLLDPALLEQSLNKRNGFELLNRDDVIVGLAFAQILIEGALDSIVRERAILALRRQAADLVLSFRGRGGEQARKVQLAKFRQILESS